MNVKTAELTGGALDWAVAISNGAKWEDALLVWYDEESVKRQQKPCQYSSDWSYGGPLIERECIATYASGACSVAPKNPDHWVAEILLHDEMSVAYGPTPLVAAMRVFVQTKSGEEIDVPKEFLGC